MITEEQRIKLKKYAKDFMMGEEQLAHWAFLCDYDDFMSRLKTMLLAKNEQETFSAEELETIETSWTKESFEGVKLNINRYLEEGGELLDEFVFPHREILNGVFPKLDKSTLSDEERIRYNVHGLQDYEFDIYADIEKNVFIPIYYDFSTVNIKWYEFSVYLVKLYEFLGVSGNPYIPLLTFDRDLLGVDAWNEIYSNELNSKIVAEAKRNIYYAAREVAKWEADDGSIRRTEMSLGDWNYIYLYAQCFNIYREAPRQTGKTFYMTLLTAIEWAMGSNNANTLILHYDGPGAVKNKKEVIKLANLLPRYARNHCVVERYLKGEKYLKVIEPGNPNSAYVTTNTLNKNVLKAVAVGKTEDSAELAGRGDRNRFIDGDEINFIKFINACLTGVMSSHATARVNALKLGLRYGIHFASTAGKLNTAHGREMYDLIFNRMCMFNPMLFGYSFKDLEEYLDCNSRTNFFVIRYEYDELGYNEKWLDGRIALARSTEEILVELFQRWISVDSSSLFDIERVRRLDAMTNKCNSKTFMFKKNNMISYYPETNLPFDELMRKTSAMCWGIDVSAGGGDYSVIYAVDMITLKPVFMFRTNNLVVMDFATVTIDLIRYVKKLNPEMTLVINPEQNGPGFTYIPILLKERDIEPHIFRTLEPYDKRRFNQAIEGWHRMFGNDYFLNYGTNMRKTSSDGVSMRNLMFETYLFEIMDKYPYAISVSELRDEILTLHRKSGKVDGKIEAKKGFHDDIVCAMLHCLTVVLNEYNRTMLTKFFNYSVNPAKIQSMALVSHFGTFGAEADEELIDLDEKIECNIKKIVVENDYYEIMELYKYVNGIKRKVIDKEEYFNILNEDEKLIKKRRELKQLNSSTVSKIGAAAIAKVPDGGSTRNNTTDVSSYAYKQRNAKNRNARMF